MSKVIVYSEHILYLTACADGSLTGDDVAETVNRERPAGTTLGWRISPDPTFRTGEPNPCGCNSDPSRKHWLLEC